LIGWSLVGPAAAGSDGGGELLETLESKMARGTDFAARLRRQGVPAWGRHTGFRGLEERYLSKAIAK